jgi:malate dehydrogenase (quinone)
MTEQIYQVAIVGGGVCGTALMYMLAEYTDIDDIILLEKYDGLAKVNSNGRNNSQTLPCGDIETN